MSEVDLAAFAAAHADGALVIDVREPHEYVDGHVPGARLLPVDHVPLRTTELPRRERVYVVCESGNRARSVVGMLRAQGLDALSLRGGTAAWRAEGRPLVTGPRANLG
ncbi:rhodanese-like domain-containing protein [Cellulomonas sp. NTE-D12]|uniref:rhodanese-like domain-containing protein n=1 Tax=Cellulomonas sp. NTE-D12 TaxID=2962632 RepID=UPI0030819DFF|nr:hypothetical protein CELD12_25440 [Cellulomonas sp. NTE-D12]